MKQKIYEQLIGIAEQCLKSQKKRPELIWLQDKCERFMKENNLSRKAELDEQIFVRMYGRLPKGSSDILKIRYWRTGRHVPANRQQCLEYGRALNLNPEEIRTLIVWYYDRSDRVFTEDHKQDPEYISRRKLMDRLVKEYLSKIPPEVRMEYKISENQLEQNLRHLYYTNAFQYIAKNTELSEDMGHIASINYGSELTRIRTLMGEISRKTMMRHLILLGMPYMNSRILNQRLSEFGYYKLEKAHTTTDGYYLDWLLIQLFEIYEKECTGKTPEYCLRWFQRACRILDEFFGENKVKALRFMYFKALGE